MRTLRVGQDGDGSGPSGGHGEVAAVPAPTGQCRVEVAGADRGRAQGHPADGHVLVLGRHAHQLGAGLFGDLAQGSRGEVRGAGATGDRHVARLPVQSQVLGMGVASDALGGIARWASA